MREDRLDQLLGIALLAQDRRAVLRMLVERGVDLVVEVVQERRGAPTAPRPRRGGARTSASTPRRRARAGAAPRSSCSGSASPRPVARHVHRPTTIPRLGMATTLSTGMQAFVIEGGRPLGGTIRAAGNKNGALPILAACLLTTEPVHLTNVPRIRDVETMLELLARHRRRGRVDRRERDRGRLHGRAQDRARRGALPPHPRVVPARGPAARALRPRGRAAARRRRDRPPPPRPAHPRLRRARRRDRDRRPLRDERAARCAASPSSSTRRA